VRGASIDKPTLAPAEGTRIRADIFIARLIPP